MLADRIREEVEKEILRRKHNLNRVKDRLGVALCKGFVDAADTRVKFDLIGFCNDEQVNLEDLLEFLKEEGIQIHGKEYHGDFEFYVLALTSKSVPEVDERNNTNEEKH